MEYIDQYNQFYSKYYLKVELLIKNFLIKYQNEKKSSNFSINLVSKCLNKYQENIFPNKEIEKLTQLFNLRYSIYQPNDSGEILKNELKKAFKEINLDEFQNYNYNKFIKELALHEVLNEISRLISNNYSLFDMMYKLNDFEKFEIKEYPNIGLENSTTFKELQNKLYPKNDEAENFEDYEDFHDENIDTDSFSLPKIIALFNELGFFSLEKIKCLNPNQQAKLISALISKTDVRGIAGNIRVLQDNSKEDGLRFTSHKHSKFAIDFYNKIK